jgi:hypothetical protein
MPAAIFIRAITGQPLIPLTGRTAPPRPAKPLNSRNIFRFRFSRGRPAVPLRNKAGMWRSPRLSTEFYFVFSFNRCKLWPTPILYLVGNASKGTSIWCGMTRRSGTCGISGPKVCQPLKSADGSECPKMPLSAKPTASTSTPDLHPFAATARSPSPIVQCHALETQDQPCHRSPVR